MNRMFLWSKVSTEPLDKVAVAQSKANKQNKTAVRHYKTVEVQSVKLKQIIKDNHFSLSLQKAFGVSQ